MGQSDRVYGALQLNGALKTARAGTADNLMSPPVATEGLGLDRDTLDYDETVGNRAPTAQEYGGRVYTGDIEGAARPDSFGLFLSMVLGPPETVETLADTVYTHTWNPIRVGNPGPLPASIWTVNRTDDGDDIIDKYVGVKGDSLSLEIANDGYLVFTMGAAAYLLDQTATEPTGVAQDLSKKFPFHVVTAQIDDGGGLTTIPLLDFGLEYSNNLVTDQFVLGSKEVENIPEGNIEPEVTFTPAADIETHYRRSLLDSPEDVRLKLNAQGAIISGAHRYSISVDLKRLQYTEAPVEIDAGESLTGVEVTAAPVLGEDGTSFIEIVMVNDNDGDIYRAPTA